MEYDEIKVVSTWIIVLSIIALAVYFGINYGSSTFHTIMAGVDNL